VGLITSFETTPVGSVIAALPGGQRACWDTAVLTERLVVRECLGKVKVGSRPSLVRTLVKSVPAGASVHCCPARQPISRNALASGLNAKRREKTDLPHHPPPADALAPVRNKEYPRRPNVKRLLGPVHGRTLRCPTLRTSVQVFICSVHLFSQKTPHPAMRKHWILLHSSILGADGHSASTESEVRVPNGNCLKKGLQGETSTGF